MSGTALIPPQSQLNREALMSSPENIVDCHLYVYWPERYPFPEGPGYRPSEGETVADPTTLWNVLEEHSVTHALLVQPGGCAFNNSAMIDTIAASQGRMKGIAAVPLTTTDDDLLTLRRAGSQGAGAAISLSPSRRRIRLTVARLAQRPLASARSQPAGPSALDQLA